MNDVSIDDALIYEILGFVRNAPNHVTTLREIVDNTSLSDYNSGNTAISLICNRGLLCAHSKDGVITVSFDARGCGTLFLDNYKYVLRLVSKEKWKERICGYFIGVLTGFTVAFLVFYFGFS